MTPITALAAFAVLTMATITIEIVYTYIVHGFGHGFSSNRQTKTRGPFGLRIERAYRNQVESAAYVVPVLAAALASGLEGADISLAALAVIGGRTFFVALYYTGLPFVRILGFSTAALGTLYIALRVLGVLGG